MKKRISLLLAVVMVLGSFASVFATDASLTQEEAESAKFLEENGILIGNSGGLLLDKELIRQDSVILLSRLLGEEDEATNHPITNSIKKFKDLPNDNYYKRNISWAVEGKYYEGTSNTTFSPRRALRVEEYATVLMRALGYSEENWRNNYDKAVELGILENVNVKGPEQDILRKDVAVMTYNALGVKIKGSDVTLAQSLGIVMPEGLSIVRIQAISKDKIEVEFNEVIDEATADNFEIKGLTIQSATLAENKKVVTLSVSGAQPGKGYSLEVKGLKVNGKEVEVKGMDFIVPEAEDLYSLDIDLEGLDSENPVLKADGVSEVVVKATLKDSKGNEIKDAGKVEIGFTTTFGRFAEKRVTAENGVARNSLTSEVLDNTRTAEVRAIVLEAENKEYIGLKSDVQLIMSPNPEVEEEVVGAKIIDAQAKMADRVTIFFNKEVKVEDYITYNKAGEIESYAIDTKKAEARVNGKAPVGIKAVEGNKKALELILDTKDVLTDNDYFTVEFIDKRGSIVVENEIKKLLIDSREPAMLSVEREGLRVIKVIFSEPVEKKSAEEVENWVIDGFQLGNDIWGSKEKEKAKATVLGYNPKTGEDNRNVVKIELGKNAKGERIYFESGLHSVQGSNIGDWASLSDKTNQNIMNTQTLNFEVPKDDSKPTAKVEVQSPEQFIVRFDKEINENLTADMLELQIKEKDGWKKASESDLLANKDKATIRVTQNSKVTSEYKVEMEKDWTVIYNTAKTKKNYYNNDFRLHIAKDKVTSATNGKKNDEINLELKGAMLNEDSTSPTIENYDHKTGVVKMSEPVKFPEGGDGLPTLGETQKSIPQPQAEFIYQTDVQADKETIQADKIKGEFVDFYDTEFTVTPSSELKAGKWKLVVSSISDDYGNTASSAEFFFEVKAKPGVQTDFKVVELEADGKDTVVVTFNKPYARAGKGNALQTSNYILNGKPLPTGTQIRAISEGATTNADNRLEIVKLEIKLPSEGYLNENNNTLSISQQIQSAKHEKLANPGTYKMNWKAPELIAKEEAEKEAAKEELEAAKKAKKAEIEEVKLTDTEKKGKTAESIEAAEEKLNELKEAAKNEVDEAKTVEEVNKVKVDKGKAIELLKDSEPTNPEPTNPEPTNPGSES